MSNVTKVQPISHKGSERGSRKTKCKGKRIEKLVKKLKTSSTKQKAIDFDNFKIHNQTKHALVGKFFEAIDTPKALACWLLYRNGEHEQLVKMRAKSKDYNCPIKLRADMAAVSFLRKNEGLKTGIDTKKVALDKFAECENACRVTNNRFRFIHLDPLFKGSNEWLLHAFTRKIAGILGDYRVEDFFDNGSWGPGASVSITGKDTSAERKFRYERQITRKLYTVVSPFLTTEYPNWFADSRAVEAMEIRNSSKLLTVAKNCETDRPICVEPGFNTWFQKSVGTSIRNRLARNGFDLNSDIRNQEMARKGSKDSSVCTVDFVSASDMISYRMVTETFPRDWLFVLEACRTASYTTSDDPGTHHMFEKFSSMGNGYTFELESIIFIAAAQAVTEFLDLDPTLITVFGDDVTLDSRGFELFRSFTEFLGFKVGVDKSFTGLDPFRESCGAFYYDGVDVKPHFQKKDIANAKSIFGLANGISRLAHRFNNDCGRALRFLPLHRHLVELLPESLRVLGAASSGDVCIASNLDEACPAIATQGWEGFLHSAFVESAVKLSSDSPSVLLTRLWYPSREMSYGNDYSLRRVTNTRFKKRIFVHQWYDFGPWA